LAIVGDLLEALILASTGSSIGDKSKFLVVGAWGNTDLDILRGLLRPLLLNLDILC